MQLEQEKIQDVVTFACQAQFFFASDVGLCIERMFFSAAAVDDFPSCAVLLARAQLMPCRVFAIKFIAALPSCQLDFLTIIILCVCVSGGFSLQCQSLRRSINVDVLLSTRSIYDAVLTIGIMGELNVSRFFGKFPNCRRGMGLV